ncbi:MAG TPA: Gfo/Idh/MocA family oxidoreductase [Candidatus Hydrogenedentes bacterium]|nr:Gfo/Idh/MocA family oxidoreductase [Candidatus Hydrogenedentota bacterium]HOL76585.1 Gfo/Idh/MocA family oxidoreductase [Candidatus Hydrogenedentota bacterium]HPO84418.1 Gfo/Idh/MocA family oxidoreductase [Candidatus Hydrogenedentota bacterium]
MSKRGFSRRVFLFGSVVLAAGCKTTPRRALRRISPNEKLNIAGIGAGGKGRGDIRNCASENIVALCDVDDNRAAESFKTFPNAKRYRDYRQMLEKERDIDAVLVSTPDHSHFPAAMIAMELGKHVFVQKPLTHSVYEARRITEAARKYQVVTQMGNQGHAGDGVRELCELLWTNTIGFVREVHIWTDRPLWLQGGTRPKGSDPVPDYLDWDLWLGPAPKRPYVSKYPGTDKDCYCPWVWRGWWDFGCGALGDMGCHIMDPANWALQLGSPTSVECVKQEGMTDEMGPTKSIIKYEFPARKFRENFPQVAWYGKTLPPVTVYWYDGGYMPPRPNGVPETEQLGEGANGSYFVGESGIVTTGCYGNDTRLVPATQNAQIKKPDPFIPRIPGGSPHAEWIAAIKEGRQPGSNFNYAGPLTEMVLLGNVAVRAGVKLEWDPVALRIPNCPDAERFLRREPRRGWRV